MSIESLFASHLSIDSKRPWISAPPPSLGRDVYSFIAGGAVAALSAGVGRDGYGVYSLVVVKMDRMGFIFGPSYENGWCAI